MVLKGTDVTARRGTGWVGVACVLLLLAADAPAVAKAEGIPLHFPTKAKHVIQIFLSGAPSHIEP